MKSLTQQEYCPSMKPWHWHDDLIKQINREDWANHANTPNPPLPKYEKVRLKLNKVSAFNLGRQIINYVFV